MKRLKLQLLLLFLTIFSLNSCMNDDCTREMRYIKYTPVYMTMDGVKEIKTLPAKTLETPGKIYFYNNYIFVNERNKGLHIIDNSNPDAPNNLAFISIPGNNDMAIIGDYLYADNGKDLVTIDISNPMNVQVLDRELNAFGELTEYEKGYLVYYNEEEVSEVIECDSDEFFTIRGNVLMDKNSSEAFSQSSSTSSTVTSGVGGSMARFTITQGHLYAVDNFQMNIFDISSNPAAPVELSEVNIGWGIETIFPYQDKLFIGSSNGMFIFDNSNPAAPTQLSSFAHARACDPVFVKDNYAYVTLRSGTWCEGFSNQIDLIDITNLTRPVLTKTFEMDNPHGLSIHDNNLFLCEGDFGLKAFDISDPKKLDKNKLDQIKDIHAYDVISVPNSNNLLVIGKDGLYQYDARDADKLELISKIEVVK